MALMPVSVLLLMVVMSCGESGRNGYDAYGDPLDSMYNDSLDAAAIDSLNALQDSLQTADSISHTHRFRINTNIGPIDGVLYGKEAPKTVNNFIDLARRRHFNRLPFHRVAPGFVIQTGNPNTRRRSSWRNYIDTARNVSEERLLEWQQGGESSFGAPFEDEIDTTTALMRRGYRRGTVAMANRGPNSNGSQFFICLRDLPELPPRYTIFGRVTGGFELIDSIAAAPLIPLRSELDGMPIDPVEIRWVTVRRTR